MRVTSRLAGWILALAACLAAARGARASEKAPEAVHPERYASPSGDLVLLVDPGDIYGRGGAAYRLTRKGKTAWEGPKPYTLVEAIVLDDGTSAGYAYSHGFDGHARDRSDRTPGDFRIVILDPAGRERLDEATPRAQSHFLHTAPDPKVLGMFADPVSDRLVVRIDDADVNRASEEWRQFSLSTGKRLASPEVRGEWDGNVRSIRSLDARPVAGTPLVLIHWWRWRYRQGGSDLGGRFTLVDPAQSTVWSLDLPNDYNVPGDQDAESRLMQRIKGGGAILATRETARFDLWFVRDARRVTFEVRKDGPSWAVREAGRVPYEAPPPDRDPAEALPERALTYLGKVVLDGGSSEVHAVRDVISFDLDPPGRVGMTRREEGDRSTFLLVEPDGRVLREVALDAAKKAGNDRSPFLAWIDGDRWLIYLSPYGVEARSPAWWLDALSGEVAEVQGFDCPSIEAVDGTGDGGFAVLATRQYRNTSEDELIAFDGAGKRLWTVKKDPADPNVQFRRDGLAVTAGKRIAVLHRPRATVDLFDLGGNHLKTLRLKDSWGHSPNYLTGIAADWEGGFLIEDFRGKSPAVLMGAEGDLRLALPPCKFPDGRAAELRSFRFAPDGGVWATDLSCIVRLTQEGMVAVALGALPSSGRLDNIAAATVDARGNLYCVEQRTGTVQVFTREGKRLRACTPAPGDFERLRDAHLTVDGEGAVCLTGEVYAQKDYLHFSPAGERAGKKGFGLDTLKEFWHAQPGTKNTWVVDHQAVFLVDPSGKTIREIRRQPDGNWLQPTGPAGVAPDGSLAVIGGARGPMPSTVSLYSAGGEPLRAIGLPVSAWVSSVAYDGRRIVVQGHEETLVLDAEGRSIERLRLPEVPAAPGRRWCFLPQGAGGELWLVEGKTKAIHRFALP